MRFILSTEKRLFQQFFPICLRSPSHNWFWEWALMFPRLPNLIPPVRWERFTSKGERNRPWTEQRLLHFPSNNYLKLYIYQNINDSSLFCKLSYLPGTEEDPATCPLFSSKDKANGTNKQISLLRLIFPSCFSKCDQIQVREKFRMLLKKVWS